MPARSRQAKRWRLQTTCRRALIALIVGVAALVCVARPAAAAGEDGYFVNAINAVRTSRGLAPLAVDGQLNSVAQAWSAQMAASGTLQHNPALATQVSNWRVVGENVGTGSSLDSIEAAFEASPHHFENMVDPQFTHIGVAVTRDSKGTYWVTEEFKQAKTVSVAAAPKPAAPSTPKPVSRPAAKPVTKPAAAPVAHASSRPVAKPATAAAAPAAPVTTTPAMPATTVPAVVLGTSAAPQPVSANGIAVRNPFTATNLAGLVAAVFFGCAMAFYARVRVTAARATTAV